MNRLVILSYDASDEFKQAYYEANKEAFNEHMIWQAIESSGLGHLIGKPVESTLLIQTDNYLYRYKEIVNFLLREFPGLYIVSGLIHQEAGSDFIDTRASSPGSEKGLQDFLSGEKPRNYTFKQKK